MTFVAAFARADLALLATDTRVRWRKEPTETEADVLAAPVTDCGEAHKLYPLRAGWLAGAGSTDWTAGAARAVERVAPEAVRARLGDWASVAIRGEPEPRAAYIREHHTFWVITDYAGGL